MPPLAPVLLSLPPPGAAGESQASSLSRPPMLMPVLLGVRTVLLMAGRGRVVPPASGALWLLMLPASLRPGPPGRNLPPGLQPPPLAPRPSRPSGMRTSRSSVLPVTLPLPAPLLSGPALRAWRLPGALACAQPLHTSLRLLVLSRRRFLTGLPSPRATLTPPPRRVFLPLSECGRPAPPTLRSPSRCRSSRSTLTFLRRVMLPRPVGMMIWAMSMPPPALARSRRSGPRAVPRFPTSSPGSTTCSSFPKMRPSLRGAASLRTVLQSFATLPRGRSTRRSFCSVRRRPSGGGVGS